MASIEDVFLQYRELCSYCDSFFKRVSAAYPSEITCRQGCAHCCTLTSVCALEAHSINRFIARHGGNFPTQRTAHGRAAAELCDFLDDESCAIYPVRPIICRTHGLPLRAPDQSRIDCCPLNFANSDIQSLKKSDVFDIGRATMNLMRLNIAFCMLIGDTNISGRRFNMESISSGTLPQAIVRLSA